jgi:alpha-soluble NSF attachment protein
LNSFIFILITILNKFFHCFIRGASKVDEAIECYQRAANLYKMAKKWSQAGQAFCEAAALHLKAAGRHDAATNYIDAANCYKKSEPNGK